MSSNHINTCLIIFVQNYAFTRQSSCDQLHIAQQWCWEEKYLILYNTIWGNVTTTLFSSVTLNTTLISMTRINILKCFEVIWSASFNKLWELYFVKVKYVLQLYICFLKQYHGNIAEYLTLAGLTIEKVPVKENQASCPNSFPGQDKTPSLFNFKIVCRPYNVLY